MIQLGPVGRLRRTVWLWLLIIVALVGGATTAVALLVTSPSSPPTKVLGEKITQTPTAAPNGVVSGTGSATANGAQVQPGNGNGGSNPGHPITVTGTSPVGLAPGVTSPLVVTVTNPNNQDIRVTAVTISVGNATGGCPAAGNITTTSYVSTAPGAATYIAHKNGHVTVPLSITMVDTPVNQDMCKHVSFPLTFTATGQQS